MGERLPISVLGEHVLPHGPEGVRRVSPALGVLVLQGLNGTQQGSLVRIPAKRGTAGR